jgi:hypothetical protein
VVSCATPHGTAMDGGVAVLSGGGKTKDKGAKTMEMLICMKI